MPLKKLRVNYTPINERYVSRYYGESAYVLNLDLITIIYTSCVSYPRRIGLVKEKTIENPSTLV